MSHEHASLRVETTLNHVTIPYIGSLADYAPKSIRYLMLRYRMVCANLKSRCTCLTREHRNHTLYINTL